MRPQEIAVWLAIVSTFGGGFAKVAALEERQHAIQQESDRLRSRVAVLEAARTGDLVEARDTAVTLKQLGKDVAEMRADVKALLERRR